MFTKRSCLFNGLLVLGFLSCGLSGCSSSSDGDGDTGGSSASSSSTSSGGSSGSSSKVGGSSGGSSSSVGGASSGGASSSSKSSGAGGSSGGKTTEASSSSGSGDGGSAQGGKATGGKGGSGGAAGGNATGGKATGGKATGGDASGGTATGGAATGGSEKGGTSGTGGAATGGSATGGSGTGGSGTGGGTGSGNGSPGCGAASPLKSGNFSEKINNQDRQWILDVPSGYDNKKPTRLIFVWHPLGGNASGTANGYNGLKALSNNSTIFVAPNGVQGSNFEASGVGWWNKDDADVKFLEAMLKKINEGLCIDQERIFSTGFSFGGMMSYTVPFVSDVFRAVAPCSGKAGVIPYTAKFSDPAPIMAFQGTSDPICSLALAKEFFDKFLSRNGCGTETKPVSPSPCVEYQGCKVPTIWCQFSGGHEMWREESAAIWKFFSQF